jgi:predicted branched-subunit amino acid permease
VLSKLLLAPPRPIGPAIPKPRGADFAFTAIFIALIISLCRGPRSGGVVASSAVTAALVRALIGSPWHVLSGAPAGIVAAAVFRIDKVAAR